jgi:biopolymer transport protein TolR
MAMNLDQKGGKGVAPHMNVTPLVDVVLVLLIIFMVVTPLLSKQFWLTLPKKDDTTKAAPPPPDAEGPIVLSVDAKGVVRINQSVVTLRDLKERVARVLSARHDKVLYFDAADDSPYGVAVEAMDLARMGGATTIAILTEKPKG